MNENGMEFVLIRTTSAGVHFGYLKAKDGSEVTLLRSRRIWYWEGACSLSQIAVDGVTKPEKCKFAVEVPQITLLGVIEIIPITQQAAINLQNVKPWTV
jgi:hypothetical protein